MTILVTGATSGFGKAIAKKFASHQWNCIITGRRKEKLEALADELKNKYNSKILTLVFDVQNREEVEEHLGQLPAEWKDIDILVNNAGLALGKESFDKANLDDWDTMINTNIKGLLYVSKAVVPYMTERGKGHIINIGSIAGKEVYPGGNVYCATKHAVDAISQAMRIDLVSHKIKVTAIHPGAAKTEFSTVRFKGDEEKVAQTYTGFTPLSAEDIADIVYYCGTLPAHVCINDLVVTPTAQANATIFHREKN